MIPEQKAIFVEAASCGVACGLEHRYEWFMNYSMHMMNIFPYGEISQRYADLLDAFLAFEKTTAGDPYEDEELQAMDTNGLIERINAYYISHNEQLKQMNAAPEQMKFPFPYPPVNTSAIFGE